MNRIAHTIYIQSIQAHISLQQLSDQRPRKGWCALSDYPILHSPQPDHKTLSTDIASSANGESSQAQPSSSAQPHDNTGAGSMDSPSKPHRLQAELSNTRIGAELKSSSPSPKLIGPMICIQACYKFSKVIICFSL